MELREYWRVFKRRAWIPIVLLVVTVLTAGALTFLSRPAYVATATVQAKATGASGSTATQTLSFQEVVASDRLALAVIKDLGLNTTPADLTRRIKVTAGHSDLYTVSITDSSPDAAVAIANDVAKQSAQLYQETNATAASTVFQANIDSARKDFLQRASDTERALLTFESQNPRIAQSSNIDLQVQYQQLQLDQQAAAAAYQAFEQQTTADTVTALSNANNFTASVLDPAVAKPDTSSRYLKVGYAAALALLLGIGLIYLLEYMDNSVREPEGVEEMVGAPVVGIIPKATSHTLRPARGGAA
ncbi:MAG TPA: Wzz/FepE/Etk N-terminal domain-containing protein [Candidatus Limnocylindrales bacterium]|nr:Wzz/FepE/Etk N-terminal domain-containing protein [Candidatus Limnocylindrales bacterium]